MNNTPENSAHRSSPQSTEARAELERALSFHFQGNRADALKALRKALSLDPGLANEKLPSNLAHELTGLAPQAALQELTSLDSGRAMIDTARRERRDMPVMRRQRLLLAVFVFLVLVFVGLLVWSIRDGTIEKVFQPDAPPEKYSLDGYEYYVSVPRGTAPEGGWPVVVVFHGYGGDALQLLPLSSTFNQAGAILIAPTFGTYEPNPGSGPIEVASRILSEVGKQHPLFITYSSYLFSLYSPS